MANNLVMQPGEKIILEDHDVLWIKSWLSKVPGRLCFTTQRLFFEVERPVAYSGRQAIANEMRNHVPIEIPRDALDGVEQGTWRKQTNVLVVKTESEKFSLFVSKPYKDWEATLRQAMHDDKVALEHVLEKLKPKDRPPPYR